MPFFKPESVNEGFVDKLKSNFGKMKEMGPGGIAKAYVNAGKRLLGGNKPREYTTTREVDASEVPLHIRQAIEAQNRRK